MRSKSIKRTTAIVMAAAIAAAAPVTASGASFSAVADPVHQVQPMTPPALSLQILQSQIRHTLQTLQMS